MKTKEKTSFSRIVSFENAQDFVNEINAALGDVPPNYRDSAVLNFRCSSETLEVESELFYLREMPLDEVKAKQTAYNDAAIAAAYDANAAYDAYDAAYDAATAAAAKSSPAP